LAFVAPLVTVGGAAFRHLHRRGSLDKVAAELKVLLSGLGTVLIGDKAAASALSHSTPEIPRDAAVFLVFSVTLFVLNWGMRLLIVEPWARWALRLRRSQLAKFAQSVMEVVIYGSFMLIGLRVVPSQEWVWPSAKWWMGFAEGGHEVMRADLRCFYIMYVARYFQAIVSVLLEPKRKDFVEMIVHHVVTVTVIYISYIYGWNRVGVVVMVLLDPADVPLHLAKLCKYTAEVTKVHFWQWVADRLFEVFAVVFFITRLVLYGYVCWSAHIEATRYFPKGLPEWTCVALLYTLLALQIYWFFLIIKVAVKLFRGCNVEDPRSDDESGAEDESSKLKKDK